MAIIKPTVGRVVWFWPGNSTKLGQGVSLPYVSADPRQPLAATIAYVHSDTMVTLSAVDHNGHQFNATSVTLIQEGDARPEYGHFCEWMPYQQKQAEKHEAA